MDPCIRDRRDLQLGRLSLGIIAADERRNDRGHAVIPHLLNEAIAYSTGGTERARPGDG
jgi:hypothetical protein